jgi:hypothetical protein
LHVAQILALIAGVDAEASSDEDDGEDGGDEDDGEGNAADGKMVTPLGRGKPKRGRVFYKAFRLGGVKYSVGDAVHIDVESDDADEAAAEAGAEAGAGSIKREPGLVLVEALYFAEPSEEGDLLMDGGWCTRKELLKRSHSRAAPGAVAGAARAHC